MVFRPLVAFISSDDCSISTDDQWLNVALNLICTSLVGVVLMAPLMNCKAWFCTLSNVARFVCVAVLRAALLYSRVGLA